MKKRIIYILICCFLGLPIWGQQSNKTAQKAAQKRAFTVVIDAGHGGHDPGAMGKLTQEKKLNLEVSQRLEQQIKLHYPDVKVVMTRKNDVFLTLQQRSDIVNKNNADLFICIHTNAAENRNVTGTETFVLGVDKLQSNLDVAMRENAVMLLEDDYQTTYEGFDPNSVDSYIMFELMQDQYIDQSLNFATLVQQQFTDIGRSDRGVRQAGFWVLHKSACPSVLIEMGFISNSNEEKYLASDKGKEDITNSIFQAFSQYKSAYDRKHGIVIAAKSEGKPSAAKADKPVATEADKPSAAKSDKPVATEADKPSAAKSDKPVAAEADKSVAAKADKPVAAKADMPVAAVELAELRPIYKVQIFSTLKPVPAGDATFRGLKNCQYSKDGKYYKYTYGEDTDYQTILDIQQELKTKFKDCFIVAFLGDKQIPVKEALQMK